MAPFEVESEKSFEDDKQDLKTCTKYIGTDYNYRHKIVWKNAIGFLILHLLALWGFGIVFTGGITWKTFIWSKWLIILFIITAQTYVCLSKVYRFFR